MAAPQIIGTRGGAGADRLSLGMTLYPPRFGVVQAGDLLIAEYASANEPMVSVTSTWTQLTGSPVGVGTPAATDASMVQLYYKWADYVDELLGIFCGDAGDHYAGHVLCIRGVDRDDPFDSVSLVSSTVTPAQTGVTLPSITTNTNDALVLYFVHGNVDTSSDISGGAWTHAGLTGFTKGANWSTTQGNGSNLMYAYGTTPTAGATGTGSATLSSAAVQAIAAIALKPYSGSYTPDPTRFNQATLEVVRSEGFAFTRVNQAALEVVRTYALTPDVGAGGVLFMDGFDHYVTADLTKKWTRAGGALVVRAAGRRSTNSIGVNTAGTTAWVAKAIPNTASFIVGFAFKFSGSPAGSYRLMSLIDHQTEQVGLWHNTDGSLEVMRNGTAVTDGKSAASVISAGTYFHIELKVTIANSIAASSCQVRVNGSTVLTVATGQDLQHTNNAYANEVRFGPINTPNNNIDFDDIYVCDQAKMSSPGFLGDSMIDTLLPTGDGAFTGLTLSAGTNHFEVVDDAAPNTTDYAYGTAGGQRDTYTFPALTATASSAVHSVQLNAALTKPAAGGRLVAGAARVNSIVYTANPKAATVDQQYALTVFNVNPNTAAAWTKTAVDGAQFGVNMAS